MAANIDRRLKVKMSPVTRKRTDRVKKAERDRMVKLREKNKTIEDIAWLVNRSERTVSKQLKKAETLQSTSRPLDPLVPQRKAEHFSYMAEIAKGILTTTLYDLEDVREGYDWDGYLTCEGTSAEMIRSDELGLRLVNTLTAAAGIWPVTIDYWRAAHPMVVWKGSDDDFSGFKRYPEYDFRCLQAHLEAEIASNDLFDAAEEHPYEVLDTIRRLSRSKMFKGTCLVCKDM